MNQAKQSSSDGRTQSTCLRHLRNLSLDRNDETQSFLQDSIDCAIALQSSPTSVLSAVLSIDNFDDGCAPSRPIPQGPPSRPVATMDGEGFEMELMEANSPILLRFLSHTKPRVLYHRPRDPLADLLLAQC